MRILALILFCVALTTVCAEPVPKKFKTEIKDRDKQSNTSLTEEERKFLREVEVKFGIKPDIEEDKINVKVEKVNHTQTKTPFPAVIAIEIVNDTDSKSKGKRTIDANLGYGYRTNKGYTYNYFGKPAQDKGKFMIYPYSQEDIPPPSFNVHSSNYERPHEHYTRVSTNVEIQPSQAFELVTEKQETGYHYDKPATELQQSNYNDIKGLVTPPITSTYSQPENTYGHSTLYTTYNGEQFSGLSGQFPTVMPNYFVDPSQLLRNPDYQNAGLTPDHLRPHGTVLDQRVVPVLVLRIPSSSLKNPTAELFANLPHNYPLSQYLNNVNIQELVNRYFKKMGYPSAPHVLSYQNSHGSAEETPTAAPVASYEPQHYATPYVQPSYTHADHSGVQYSAVQPVMARYPSSYPRKHYILSHGQSLYQQPQQQQRYEYQYQYVPQSAVPSQSYYVHPKYQQQTQAYHGREETVAKVQYEVPSQITSHGSGASTLAYTPPQASSPHYEAEKAEDSAHYASPIVVPSSYDSTKEEGSDEGSTEYHSANEQEYHSKDAVAPQYYTEQQPEQKEDLTVYSSPDSGHRETFTHADASAGPHYIYQQQIHQESDANGLVLSENYPSKDHTIATVLPLSYKNAGIQKTTDAPVQSVSYVTPLPHSYKYQSPYRVMVPQTVFRSPSSEKVSYVNSQPMSSLSQSSLHQDHNPEEEYTVSAHFVPPVSKQRPTFPRNYHSYSKRMSNADSKAESSNKSPVSRKQHDKKKTS